MTDKIRIIWEPTTTTPGSTGTCSVPMDAKKIFEEGCAYGNFGALVKSRNPDVTYYGMELDPKAAKVASAKLDHVFWSNIESSSLLDDQFDCIPLGDVLEHLCNPL